MKIRRNLVGAAREPLVSADADRSAMTHPEMAKFFDTKRKGREAVVAKAGPGLE